MPLIKLIGLDRYWPGWFDQQSDSIRRESAEVDELHELYADADVDDALDFRRRVTEHRAETMDCPSLVDDKGSDVTLRTQERIIFRATRYTRKHKKIMAQFWERAHAHGKPCLGEKLQARLRAEMKARPRKSRQNRCVKFSHT